jgi:hypothetical protein
MTGRPARRRGSPRGRRPDPRTGSPCRRRCQTRPGRTGHSPASRSGDQRPQRRAEWSFRRHGGCDRRAQSRRPRAPVSIGATVHRNIRPPQAKTPSPYGSETSAWQRSGRASSSVAAQCAASTWIEHLYIELPAPPSLAALRRRAAGNPDRIADLDPWPEHATAPR